ncbi:MAG: hypothetical protein IT577_08345 [Verrucomicrobiae bacterium]|nr:hypothetical protein [Verrucomicrobiae bacterium]
MPRRARSPWPRRILTLVLAVALTPACSRGPTPPAPGRAAGAPAPPPAPPEPRTPHLDPAPPAPVPIEEGVHLILAPDRPEPTTTFELRFDSPVIAPDRVGETPAESPLLLDPPLRGSWTWLSTRSGVFAPEEPLRMAQRYALSLAPIKDAAGKPVAARLDRRIETPGLEILTRPPQPETNAVARPHFVIHFNADVDPAALEPYIAFADASGRVAPASLERLTSYYALDGYYADAPALAPWHLRFPGAQIPEEAPRSPDGRTPVPNAIQVRPVAPLPPGQGWRLIL